MATDIRKKAKQAAQQKADDLARSGVNTALIDDDKKLTTRARGVINLGLLAEKVRSRFAKAQDRFNDVFADFEPHTKNAVLLATLSLLFAAVIPAAYLIDYYWMGFTTEYILSLGGEATNTAFAKAVFPLGVIIVELCLGHAMASAYNRSKLRGPALIWGLLSAAYLTWMCSITAAALTAATGATTFAEMDVSDRLLVVASTGISAMPHAVLIFAGQIGSDAKGFFTLLKHEWVTNRLNFRYDRKAADTLTGWDELERDIERFEQRYNVTFKRPVFPKEVRHIINSAAGAELIPPPAAPYGEYDPEPAPAPVSVMQALRNRENGAGQ